MRFLVEDTNFSLPITFEDCGLIFKYAALRNAEPQDTVARLEAMKQYIRWPDAYTRGLEYAMRYGIKEVVVFCLDNGGDPNGMIPFGSGPAHPLELAVIISGRNFVAHLEMLLQYGADPKHPDLSGIRNYIPFQWLELHLGISWEEFALRAAAGESFHVIVPSFSNMARQLMESGR